MSTPGIVFRFWLGVAPDVHFCRLIQENHGQYFRDVIHTRLEKVAPGVAIVFDANVVDLAILTGRKNYVIAVGNQAFNGNLTLHGRLGRVV
jgi:hypothetical protein